ncbi:MAG: hypothetical protein AAFR93_12815 [Pseudomonadota bacterium]
MRLILPFALALASLFLATSLAALTPEELAECLLLDREITNLERSEDALSQARATALAQVMEARLQRRTLADTARVDAAAAMAVIDLDQQIADGLEVAKRARADQLDITERRAAQAARYNAGCAGVAYDQATYERALRVLRTRLRGGG